MKKLIWIAATTTLATGTAMAQELGRVLSTSAVQRQVVVPQQVCHDESVPVRQRSSGAGAVIGAVVGGVLGNQIGGGMGRAALTAAGAVGGAVAGNAIEGRTAPGREVGGGLYRISIQLDQGGQRVYDVPDPSDLRPGDRVRMIDGQISRY